MLSHKNDEKDTIESSAEAKQNRLVLDLQILSSLNSKSFGQFNSLLNLNNPIDEDETIKKNQTNSIFSPLKGNFEFEKNIQILNNYNNPLNILGNNYTNLTYYQEPVNFENISNSRNNSIMSFKNLNPFPEIHKTNESFYFNYLQPIKHDTNEFIKQKRLSELSFYNNVLYNFDNPINSLTENVQKNITQGKIIKQETIFKKKNVRENENEKKIVLFKTKKGKKLNNNLSNNNTIGNKKLFYCKHNNCDGTFVTKKLLLSHHKKFNPECHSDTVYLFELIKRTKNIIKNGNYNNSERLKEKYNNIMKNVSLDEYAQLITGLKFD
jgi:hypothetical protein